MRIPWTSSPTCGAEPDSGGPDGASVRSLIVDTNDGIIATAGIVEGFASAGATGTTILVAALSAMVAGGISLAGAKYAEAAAERDAHLALIDDERRQLALSPDEELAELATYTSPRD